MKKILSVIMLILLMLFTSCSNGNSDDEVTRVTKYLSNLNSYNLSSTMNINRSDKKLMMNVDVDYLAPGYYKVSFKTGDNNEQLIIKNDDGVFVLNPSLNKQFKFDSDWPLNSSHAYLLEAIVKDMKNDTNVVGTTENGVILIECAITHKNNQNLIKMQYLCDKDSLAPKKTVFLNEKGDEVIIVDFNSFTPNKELTKDYFSEKQYLNNQQEGSTDDETSTISVTTGYVIEGNTLQASTTTNNVTILCYSGEKPYTIIVQEALVYSEVVVLESYDTFEILSSGLCLVNENCIRYYLNGYEITIYSNSLSLDEYMAIAENINLV